MILSLTFWFLSLTIFCPTPMWLYSGCLGIYLVLHGASLWPRWPYCCPINTHGGFSIFRTVMHTVQQPRWLQELVVLSSVVNVKWHATLVGMHIMKTYCT